MEERVGIMYRILWVGLEVVFSVFIYILSVRVYLIVRGFENRFSCVFLVREEKYRSANIGIFCIVYFFCLFFRGFELISGILII